ncbi:MULTISPECIES: DUF3769 domain-containing protein [unclassified Cyanobium]|uniref:DUF3769 domain-containing protein n=1 Tax=unclassified Cyanobium TaxID=2627006 RepID=UPI0020CE1D64|nr:MULTISPECIES: DUF3769 domain-containing protein [unclassified Cyanobium]MCP9776268.1 DUF3769 domain-containing protein [Cyanobium sp. Tous-M-B4]
MPLGKRPLRRLARQLLTAACLSALFAPKVLANDIPSQPGAVTAASSVSPAPNFAVIKADQQSYDQQLGRFVATGNVEARFNGWRLLADRVELAEASRSVYASGQIRLIKGDQYLQASRLRYSDLEGSGELDDVYGVIDQDTLARDINSQEVSSQEVNSQQTKAKTNGQPSDVSQPAFACPPLSADPGNRTMLRVLPPGRSSLPTMPAPAGCLGSELSTPALSLNRALESVAFGPPQAGGPQQRQSTQNPSSSTTKALEIGQLPEVDSKVRDVAFQQSWSIRFKLDLAAVIDTTDSLNNRQEYRPPTNKAGTISRVRFQGAQIQIRGNRWTAEQIAFTNDPFTPAASWILARKVVALMDGRGKTRINSRSTQILLDGKVSLPAITNTTIGAEEGRLAFDTDKQDRDGFFLGYNLEPIKLGQRGSLQLQPQLNVQRALEGRTSSYALSGQNLASPGSEQTAKIGDMFGLLAALNLPMGWLSLNAEASLSTFNPDNFRAGTRSNTSLTAPFSLPGHSSANASLFGSYRERIYNGSLGLQTVVYSYGANLAGNALLNQYKNPETSRKSPFIEPINLNWAVQSGSYQAELFETDTLDTLWRSYANLAASTTLQLWQGSALDASEDPKRGLRYSPIPVAPSFGINFGASGYAATYSDGANQNTLTLWGGPSFTLGQFDRPVFDYTRFSASIAGTFLNGASPFGFDRTVDLRTLSFQAAQQIYGPIVLEAGATFNIDNGSEFYGDVSYSYVELKLQRRSYELGVYYSPYDGIGGIRVKLNDFNFTGSGTPFVPRPRSR